MRIVQISDLHLSRTHGYFYQNWLVTLDELNANPPDLVVVSGDVSFNGADSSDDLSFAREEITRITAPTVVLPGNHDIGDHPMSKKLDQPVNSERLERWFELFETDRFSVQLGSLRVVGFNTELLGSGLPEETAQWHWLDAELTRAAEPTLVFMHKPLFARDPFETEFNKSCVDPVARERLWRLFESANVAVIASAHVHVYKQVVARGIEFVWCPATSFVVSWEGKDVFDGVRRTGWIEFQTDGATPERPSHRWIEPARLVNYDMRNWFMQNGSTVKLPPQPLLVDHR